MARGEIGFDDNDDRLKDRPLKSYAKNYAKFFVEQFDPRGRLS